MEQKIFQLFVLIMENEVKNVNNFSSINLHMYYIINLTFMTLQYCCMHFVCLYIYIHIYVV